MKAFAIATAASRSSHHRRKISTHQSPKKISPVDFGESSTMPFTLQTKVPLDGDSHFSRISSTAVLETDREALVAGMTVLRVLNVARHWITKYPEVCLAY